MQRKLLRFLPAALVLVIEKTLLQWSDKGVEANQFNCFRCSKRGVQTRWGRVLGNILSTKEKHASGEGTLDIKVQKKSMAYLIKIHCTSIAIFSLFSLHGFIWPSSFLVLVVL